MSEIKFYFKIGNQDEQEINDAFPKVSYLGHVGRPEFSNIYNTPTIVDGEQFIQTVIAPTTITCRFMMTFSDWYDYQLNKNQFYGLFGNKDLIRIRTDSFPAKVAYVRPQSFDVIPSEDGSNSCIIEVVFDVPSGYKQSIMRSDSLYTYGENAWQVGMNLPNGQKLNYTFNGDSSIRVYNASDVDIDPYFSKHDLRILINFAGSGIKISNSINGTEWSYNKAQSFSDSIVLDGVDTTLNGTNANLNTDFGYIKLNKGWNDIVVTGTTQYRITFSFPFLYLD
ncbi:phage tail family protein [Oenococcus oeni]